MKIFKNPLTVSMENFIIRQTDRQTDRQGLLAKKERREELFKFFSSFNFRKEVKY